MHILLVKEGSGTHQSAGGSTTLALNKECHGCFVKWMLFIEENISVIRC